jgi:hypothetical protein
VVFVLESSRDIDDHLLLKYASGASMTLVSSFTFKLLRRLGLIDALARIRRGHISLQGNGHRFKNTDISTLIASHFSSYSDEDHPCRPTLTTALELLSTHPAIIVETGSSAWGTNSTLLFDSYCNSFGGVCYSVDIRMDPMLKLRKFVSGNTRLYCDDSVSFLNTLKIPCEKIDLLYLDSWDVDWSDPIPSAVHGLNEYLAAMKNLQPGSLVLIDDTPRDLAIMEIVQPHATKAFRRFQERFGFAPGKGALVKQLIESTGRGTVLAHEYQLLIRI